MSATGASVRFTARRRSEAMRDAVAFLAERYDLDPAGRAALAAVPVRWRRGRRASTFLAPRDGSPGRITVTLPRGSRGRWHTYRRVRAGLVTPRSGIEMDLHMLARLILVHELTHAIQHGTCGGPRRRYSEVETTRNEIGMLLRLMPEARERLLPLQARRRQPDPSEHARCGFRPLSRLLDWLLDRAPTSARARRSRAARGLRPARAG
jgi:hypothetical protein